MSDAMSYEYLLRRIYKVGRHDKNGVNADVYRNLEHAESLYKIELKNIEQKLPRTSNRSIDDLSYEYRVECRKIWSFISEAITIGISKFSGTFSKDEVTLMEKSLVEPKIVDKEHIDNAIETTEKIYIKHGIYPV